MMRLVLFKTCTMKDQEMKYAHIIYDIIVAFSVILYKRIIAKTVVDTLLRKSSLKANYP